MEVIGVDEVADSIKLANDNARLNSIKNAKFTTQRVDQLLLNEDFQEFRYRMHSDLNSRYQTDNHHFDTIIVDPARPGLEGKVCRRLQKYFEAETVIYISCNPVTQKADLQRLSTKYDIVAIQAFDLFPQTFHVESVAILRLKS